MMDKDKKYVVGVFLGAVALIIIMLITTIIDIIKIIKMAREKFEKMETPISESLKGSNILENDTN